MTVNEQLHTVLKRRGYSMTTSRALVFNALHGTEPVTMRELVERCKAIDRASVYRTVALYEQLGIISRLQTGWKYSLELSGDFQEHHHHATCYQCGKTTILAESLPLEQLLSNLAQNYDFALESHTLELRGTCLVCQQATAA